MDKRQSSEPVPAVGAELATIMESLAAGEGAAIHWLIEAHRADLARTVRAIASARKRSLNAELVDELVLEAALAVREVAGEPEELDDALEIEAIHRLAPVTPRHARTAGSTGSVHRTTG